MVENEKHRYRHCVRLRGLCSIGMAVIGSVLLMLAGGGVASSQPEAATRAAPAHVATALGSLPVSARSAVSATLGAASRAYVARRSPTGYRLKGGGVAAQLDAGGVSLQAGGVSLVMTAASLG